MTTDYPAQILRIVDGDTLVARLAVRTEYSRDLAMTAEFTETVRLDGLNAPELPTPEGIASRDWLTTQIQAASMVVTLRADFNKREKFGRLLGRVLVDGVDLNTEMIKAGFAKPYSGRGLKS